MRHSRVVGVAVFAACAVLVGLTGCGASDGYPIFQEDADSEDVLPADFDSFDSGQLDDYDLETVRFAATYERSELYLLKTSTGAVCLAIAAGTRSGISCGGAGLLGTSIQGVGVFETGPAPIGEKDGWTVLSENIRVQD